ncbi:MAG: hypothetical protein ABI263_03390 [Gelidibacter sp.]
MKTSTSKNSSKNKDIIKKIVIALFVIVALIILDTVVLDSILDKNVDNAQIEKVLKDHCDCTGIKNEINGKGLSFTKGVYGDYHVFKLSNCKYDNFENFIENLHINLKDSIGNFCEANLVELKFENSSTQDRIVNIRKCDLTIKK